MFKKALVPALVLAAASVAVPAAAQSYHGPARGGPAYSNHGGWQSINQRKYILDRRIDQGVRSRTLSPREARDLRMQLNSLVRLEMTYQRRGLTLRERQDLDRRYDRLAFQIRVDRRDRDGRPH
jgi:hypothetical protein